MFWCVFVCVFAGRIFVFLLAGRIFRINFVALYVLYFPIFWNFIFLLYFLFFFVRHIFVL